MVVRKVMPRLRALIVIALLASGAAKVNNVHADSVALSGVDVLDQAVSLYEKMHDAEVEVPDELSQTGLSDTLLKSVVLGYVNLDESEALSMEPEIRKQDVMTIFYKAILNYDSSYAISEDEADSILNTCYDNALLDEENRIGYAFFIKQNIIEGNMESEPNKPLNWDSCKILLDLIYNSFIQDVDVNVNGTLVSVGSNINTVTDAWGAPNRIDKSEYGFDWYVYNTDYTKLCMVGVDGERICAVYTNSDDFEFNGIKYGDDASVLDTYKNNPHFRMYADHEGKVDSIMYCSTAIAHSNDPEICENKNLELLDMINAYRAKHGYSSYVLNEDISNTAWMEAIGFMGGVESKEAETVKGYDIFTIYRLLIESDSPILSEAKRRDTAIGISTPLSDTDKYTYAAFIVDKGEKAKREVTYVAGFEDSPAYDGDGMEAPFAEEALAEEVTEEITKEPVPVTAPQIININDKFEGGKDIVLELKESVSNKYHLQVFDIENENYLINSYITTDSTQIIIPCDGLSEGSDYLVSLTAADNDGAAVGDDSETLITYGDAGENALSIIGPVSNTEPEEELGVVVDGVEVMESTEEASEAALQQAPAETDTQEVSEEAPEFLKDGYEISEDDCIYIDTDYIPLQWYSSVYHDFCIDMYNSDGELVVNTVVEDDDTALIQGIDPGTYYIYVTALSRGTMVEKAQDMIRVTVTMPKPVVNEIILDKDDKYYFVYEDEALGVLYFYDEEIIEVEEDGETVKKKKIIQKQVKSTKAYRELAKYRYELEYVTGDPTVTALPSKAGTKLVNDAMSFLGVPYVWGGTTPAGFDCSGLVQYVCAKNGIKIDRVTHEQILNGVEVPGESMLPGDLVFFKNSSGYVHHVGMYIGDDKFIHAPHTGDVVKISSLNDSYYASTFCGARRVY